MARGKVSSSDVLQVLEAAVHGGLLLYHTMMEEAHKSTHPPTRASDDRVTHALNVAKKRGYIKIPFPRSEIVKSVIIEFQQ